VLIAIGIEMLQASTLLEQNQQLQRERDDARNRLASLTDEMNKINSDQQQQVAPPSSVNSLPTTNGTIFLFSDVKDKVAARMKRLLNLTDEQERVLEDRLSDYRLGAFSPQLRALLTPEQQAAYDQLKEADASAAALYDATTKTTDLEFVLGLTADQQQEVLNALLENQSSVAPPPTSNAKTEPSLVQQQELEKELAALKGTLTPDQIEQYLQYRANPPPLPATLEVQAPAGP